MAEKKFLDLLGLQKYDEKIKAHQAAADEKVLADAKEFAENLADNYDAAGTAATKMQELAEGAVATNADGVAENKAAIEKLNGDAATDGSVAKAVADAKALIDADIDAIQEDIGSVDALSTTNKTLSGAINEVLAAVGSGGTAAVIAVNAKGSTDDYAQVYEITQGGVAVGTINIPKDMVVESGEVVDVDGIKNIKLVLQNVEAPLYIPVGSLVDIYVAKAEAAQVQIAIDSATREISANIVSGSVTATELAANAVITEKIADKNVTKAKLSAEVQASLDKADAAAQDATDKAAAAESAAKGHADSLNTAMNTRVEALEAIDHDHANAAQLATYDKTQAELLAAAKAEAEGLIDGVDLSGIATNAGKIADIETSLAEGGATANAIADAKKAGTDASDHADELNTAMNDRVEALEAIDHDHSNKDILDGVTAEKVAAWDAAESNAKNHADGLNTAMDSRVVALETWHNNFTEVSEAEINALFA